MRLACCKLTHAPPLQVIANYSAAGLPLETVMVDIEYMGGRFQSMTYDDSE